MQVDGATVKPSPPADQEVDSSSSVVDADPSLVVQSVGSPVNSEKKIDALDSGAKPENYSCLILPHSASDGLPAPSASLEPKQTVSSERGPPPRTVSLPDGLSGLLSNGLAATSQRAGSCSPDNRVLAARSDVIPGLSPEPASDESGPSDQQGSENKAPEGAAAEALGSSSAADRPIDIASDPLAALKAMLGGNSAALLKQQSLGMR